jgi:hypothetical protein
MDTYYQARISPRAGGLQPGARRVGGPGFEALIIFFFAGVKNFACENLAIGPFSPKISPAVLFNV